MSMDDFVVTYFTKGAGINTPLHHDIRRAEARDQAGDVRTFNSDLCSRTDRTSSGQLYAADPAETNTTKTSEQKGGFLNMKKSVKKNLLAACLLLMLGLLTWTLMGCGNTGEEESSVDMSEAGGGNTITVLNYGEYIDTSVLRDFEKETGIKVLYEEATTPEEMYSKYTSSTIPYDLICSSDYMIERLIAEGEAVELDHSKMQYVNNIGDFYWELSRTYDPENKYSIPYFWGTVGILYNKSMIHEEITSWDSLFNGEYAGEIIMQNSIRDAYMCALKYQGHSLNTTNRKELQQAQNLLLKQKPDVEAYFVDEVREEMVAGNAALAVCYSGEAYLAHEYENDLEYVLPEEGSNIWIDSWIMMKKGKNHEGAQKFLDYLCRGDVAVKNFEEIYYPTPNTAAYNSLDEEVREDPLIFPEQSVVEKCEVYKALDDKTMALYSQMWKELKTK